MSMVARRKRRILKMFKLYFDCVYSLLIVWCISWSSIFRTLSKKSRFVTVFSPPCDCGNIWGQEAEKVPLLDPMALCFCSPPLQRLRCTNRNDLFLKGQSPHTKRSSSQRRVPQSNKQTLHCSLGKHIYNQNRISIFHIRVKPAKSVAWILQELESLCCRRCSVVRSQASRSGGNLSGTTLLIDL